MPEHISPEKIMQTGLGFWSAKTLLSAVELGVFTALAQGPMDEEALRARLKLHPRGARDFFDTLHSLGFLRRDGRVYSNAPETDLFLDRAKPSYIGGMLEMANARLYKSWGSLTEALREGQLKGDDGNGDDIFASLYADPEKRKRFLQAMTGISMGAANAIAAKFPWKNYKSFIDVGAAQGGVPVQIALAHSHLSGGGSDLPAVRPDFEEYVASRGLKDRLRFYPCDFFNEPLPNADVLIMGHILHDWNLEQKRMLLGKAFEALPPGGALIVYEALIDDDRSKNAFGLLMSLNMLIETPGGFDYTGADCQSWMRDAGFSETRVEHLVGPDSMVVGIKPV